MSLQPGFKIPAFDNTLGALFIGSNVATMQVLFFSSYLFSTLVNFGKKNQVYTELSVSRRSFISHLLEAKQTIGGSKAWFTCSCEKCSRFYAISPSLTLQEYSVNNFIL